MIGMRATVMDDVVVGAGSMVGAAALVPPRKQVAPREIWIGAPAKRLRSLTDQELKKNRAIADNYLRLAEKHLRSLAEITQV